MPYIHKFTLVGVIFMGGSTASRTLAVSSHDGKIVEILTYATENKDTLSRYKLVATNTTGTLLSEKTGLEIKRVLSGPAGGDAQIAVQIAEGKIAAVFFFVDPLGKHPHDPDIQTLLRICN